MTLPVGVVKANLTFGVPLDDAGTPIARARVTILAALDRVWAATGDLVLAHNIVVELDGAKVVPLAATDQPGFVNGAGQPVTNWTLDAIVDVPGRARQLITFALPTGGVDGLVVDFDRLVPVAQSTGQVVAVTTVTSVNGETGAAVLDAVDVGALPSNAPAVLKNPTANAKPLTVRNAADTVDLLEVGAAGGVVIRNPTGATFPFRIRNAGDTGDVFAVTTANGTVTIGGGFTAAASLNAQQNDVNAISLAGAAAGIRFGSTAGQTYIQRTGAQALATDSALTSTGPMTALRQIGQANDADALQATGAAGGIRFGPTSSTTYIQRVVAQILKSDSTLALRATTTGSRPTAAAVGVAGQMYDTTLGKPIWSDGAVWRDAAGTIV